MSKLNIKFNNKNYEIPASSLADATARLEAHLLSMMNGSTEEVLEGDGQEFHKFAPTALSFRSTAPLNELKEIQINGVTVDPSNYTLEEGSTIVTFPIDYLKTLSVGGYEVAVASDSKTVKGDFSVKAPELNEHGFYYNQPYSAYVPYYGSQCTFFIRENGTYDFINGSYIETGTYEIDGSDIMTHSSLGDVPATLVSSEEIRCDALGTSFVLYNDTSIAADEDYIYVYKEDLGGYEVTAIDKTKAEYAAIKTGVNGIDTVKLADDMFFKGTDYENTAITSAPHIPNSVTSIGDFAFYNCGSLTRIDIPDSVVNIGMAAFSDCTSLKNITIPDGVTAIQDNTFNSCESLTNVIIPDSVTSIGDNAFYGCTSLTSVAIGNGVTSIGNDAFYGCKSLTSVHIPDSVTSIGNEAFGNCESLTSVTIPASVTNIGGGAFGVCQALENIIFKGTVAQWNAITKGNMWNDFVPATHVHCTDGDVAL